MSQPRKHHYIPVFYLKQWVGADGRLCEHKLVHGGKVAPRRTHPDGTGYQVDLYRIDGVPEHIAQHVEAKFMSLLDGLAAQALQEMLTGRTGKLPIKLREAWARFIMSLLFRNPEAISFIKGHLFEVWAEGFAQMQAAYEAQRQPDEPASVEEYFKLHEPHAPAISVADFVQGVIDNERVGPTIMGLHWHLVRLPKSNVPLLTSDRPLDFPLGLGHANTYIALPVGPYVLFVASRNPRLPEAVADQSPTKLVKLVNLSTVSTARTYVWGVTDSQLSFVQKRIRTGPDRQLLTDGQRQEAIDAARGKAPPPALAAE